MRTNDPGRRLLVGLAVLALVGVPITGCTSTPTAILDTATTRATPTPAPTPTAMPTPAPTPTPTPTPELLSPLTGKPIKEPRPVLVVKLDNTRYAQPHAGLDKADLVYIEEVEYGITRLAAVFSSHLPQRIGPVRSARITDIDLLAQYDRPAFGFSGAQRKMFPALAAASFYDVSPGTGGEGYSRDYQRRAPYNYYLDGRIALARAPKATLAHDMGFTFAAEPPPGGLVARTAAMTWSFSSASFRYQPRTGLYAVSLNGERARSEAGDDGQNAATVVIQYVKQTPSAYFDRGGGNTPHAQTIGTGKALVLRDGLAWPTTWSRPTAEDGTTFTLADGTLMPFKPGQTWIVLLDRKRGATVQPLTDPSGLPGSGSPAPTP